MRLAFSTLGCPDWSIEKVLYEARTRGFEAVELRGVDGELDPTLITRFNPENCENAKALFAESSVRPCVFGSSISLHDADLLPEMFKAAQESVSLCKRMGIPAIRVFGNSIKEDEYVVINRVGGALSEICKMAEPDNIAIWLEVHGDFNTLERLQAVIDRVPYGNFGIVWDIAHSDRNYRENYEAFMRPLLPYIRHIHIKDHIRLENGTKLCLPGRGDIPIKPIVRSLLESGYDGLFSLEWEKRWHPELEELETALDTYIRLMNC